MSELYDDEYYETDCGHTDYFQFIKYFPEKTKTILDLGCGDGKGLLSLDSKAEKLVGVDSSRVAINLAELSKERTMLRSDVYFYVSDFVFKIKTYGKFDVILMIDSIEHNTEIGANEVVKELKNHLNQNGIIIIHTPIYENREAIAKRIKKAMEEKDKDKHECWIFNMHINLQTREDLEKLFKDYDVQFPEKDTVLARRK